MPSRKRWTHGELHIALNLYHKLTFGQMHSRQPAILELARRLGRTPGSVAMKLCNFASLDPALRLRGIRGLDGASALDRTVWEEFHRDLNETVPASEMALRELFEVESEAELEVLPDHGFRVQRKAWSGATEMASMVKLRRGQGFFREAVLNNFAGCCGVTGLSLRELLVASHILPWATHPDQRVNVRNGLALSRLHDAAFDQGLITFDDDLRLMLSPRLTSAVSQRSVADNFAAYAGQPLALPADAAAPDPAFLAQHRTTLFLAT